jgi:TRAP-type C4-dicarboxylate transport system substrate-binding protein
VPPVFALFGRFYGDVGKAKYMLEINWAPLVGAAVVRKKAWDRTPADARPAMLKAAADIGLRVKADGRKENDAAVEAMAKRGLTVQKVSPEVEAEWRAVAENVQDKIRGQIVPAATFDEAQRLLSEYRTAPEGKPK